ncbi:MAG: hypothetical protein ACW9WZ_02095 [Nitrosopumilus sp.]
MKKIIFSVIFLVFLISLTPISFGQISIGEKAVQKSVEVYISNEGEVHVIHEIRKSNSPKQIDLIEGVISNIKVIDEDGKEVLHSVLSDGEKVIAIVVMSSSEDYNVEYDLNNALIKNGNFWEWDFLYLEKTSFILPDELELLFANDNLVFLGDKKGIACHGCDMLLQFSFEKNRKFVDVNWEDRKFVVEFLTDTEIEQFVFDQPMKTISFDVNESEKNVLTLIPLELLWGPYAVFLDDEKIRYNDNYNNGTHVWIHVKPETPGTVSIIGTTVVPEFSMFIPLIMGFMIILTVPLMKKFSLR